MVFAAQLSLIRIVVYLATNCKFSRVVLVQHDSVLTISSSFAGANTGCTVEVWSLSLAASTSQQGLQDDCIYVIISKLFSMT